MTANEILRQKVTTITFDKLIGTPIEQVIIAMEEYGKQQWNEAIDAVLGEIEFCVDLHTRYCIENLKT